jgi:hypothetical protein
VRKSILPIALSVFSLFLLSNYSIAQSEQPNVINTILFRDSLFWNAYNSCDIAGMQQHFSDDVEFYHDKGGLTVGLQNLITATKTNLCGNENFRLRREAVAGSIKVYPLQKSGVTYGAIISGEHVFYVVEKGKPERLDGLAKFTHVWMLTDNNWKMSRILSYDHGPAPYINRRKVIKVADVVLDQLSGQYIAPQSGICTVRRENDLLNLTIGDQKYILHPQSDNSFFAKDRDLTFEFKRNEKGNVSKLIVRENGNVVEEATRKN